MRDLHPQPNGGGRNRFIPSKSVRTGDHNEAEASYSDDGYVRCRQCGFMNHIHRQTQMEEGSRAGDSINLTGTYGTEGRIDPTVSAGGGCPMCGSYRFV